LDRRDSHLGQPDPVDLRERRVADIDKSVAPPKLEGVSEVLGGLCELAVAQRLSPSRRQALEAERVNGVLVDAEHVAIASTKHGGGTTEPTAEGGHLPS